MYSVEDFMGEIRPGHIAQWGEGLTDMHEALGMLSGTQKTGHGGASL